MEFGPDNTGDKNGVFPNRNAQDVQVIVKVAHEELRRLIRQRAEIMKRIGTIKQTIVGLCNLFGDEELSDDLRALLNRNAGVRRPGITQACRTVLMAARCPVNVREVCEQIQERSMPDLPPQKNLVAAVTTVLNRLVEYGEARTVRGDRGPRTWVWVSDAGDRGPDLAQSAEILLSQL